MPIYNKAPPLMGGNHSTAEIDYHTSEAAKVKQTREQAYFNSYDFDAIEVLPYDDEEDEEDDRRAKSRERSKKATAGTLPDKNVTSSQTKKQIKLNQQMQQSQEQQHFSKQQHFQPQLAAHYHQRLHQQQKQQKQHNSSKHSLSAGSSSSDSFMVDTHHVSSKYNPAIYLQRISGIFTNKTSNNNNNNNSSNSNNNKKNNISNNNNNSNKHLHHQHESDGKADISHVASAIGDGEKHFKLSSSETSSTSLSSSSVVEGILSGLNGGSISNGGVAVGVGVGVGVCGRAGGAGGGGGSVAVGALNIPANSSATSVTGLGDNRDIPMKCVKDATGIVTRLTTADQIVHSKSGSGVLASSAAAPAPAGTSGGSGGKSEGFLLTRPMLKYPSSMLTQGASGITTTCTNSMPLATNTNNLNSKQSQQQWITTTKDGIKLDGGKGKAAISSTNSGNGSSSSSNTAIRLKKNSATSSLATSLDSDDIVQERMRNDGEFVKVAAIKIKDEKKVIPKTINPKTSARASSHQSHYSTDISASSGYYSSNVCSTYSMEEHIYSEPAIDLKKLRQYPKESNNKPPLPLSPSSTSTLPATSTLHQPQQKQQQQQRQQQQQQTSFIPVASKENSVMRALDYTRHNRFADKNSPGNNPTQALPAKRNSQEFSENLKILESSIENLDRHLKLFPGVTSPEALVNYAQNPYGSYAALNQNDKIRGSYNQLPTIQEAFDAVKKQSWREERSDDSLLDIDLDSFLLDKDKKITKAVEEAALNSKGLDNPTFLTEEQEENHYKCAKYINSCPEDAYRVESDIIAPTRSSISEQSVAISTDLYPKRYEEQIHFENTRELLEDVRDKIRLLTQSQEAGKNRVPTSEKDIALQEYMPKELHAMINTLKEELELYLDRMNRHSELEIRQLCTGLVKNQHIVKMKNAFERKRSLTVTPDIYSSYEAIKDGIVMNTKGGLPISIRQEITSIRCTSDPNFKMKRKSITEVFPMAECYVETIQTEPPTKPSLKPKAHPHTNVKASSTPQIETTSQLQKNLSYHKPVLEQLNPSNTNANPKTKGSSVSGSAGDASDLNDKDSILDWHRKKPSIWEMYYGTNRIQQSLLAGKKSGLMITTPIASSPSNMCYPSSRPESDFTLDLPRAEQLRIKMEKEKKFRQRCRVITTFLSLVFFLLTVMVVSLVLTRGKRMFGSMI